ncbi:MAG: DUF4236 domain-containing protein [Ardenticatenales bacterium]|nr:DUF4236 domain-containing protein [Ardenticatenales bacterium]
MGIRFAKRINLGKFVRLNISKSGIGISVGVQGARISTGPSGTRLTAGIPGTGISYVKQFTLGGLGGTKKSTPQRFERSIDQKQIESETEQDGAALPELPAPGWFAPGYEKSFYQALNEYLGGDMDAALAHFQDAAPEEPGAAILAATIHATREGESAQAIELLEAVLQSDTEFPTPLMEKYLLAESPLRVAITPNVEALVPIDGLGAALVLAELYQNEGRVEDAIGLLEELEELAEEPILTLSLCELYGSVGFWEGVIERAANTQAEDDVTLETMILRGRALQEKGLHEAAVAIFTPALRKKKDRSPDLLREAAYWRAMSYQALGKKAQANRELQKIYAEAPHFRDVAQRLEL